MKRLSYLFLLFLLPFVAFAQVAPEQEKENKEKIKEIKLSEEYVYADAVTEDNLSEAQQNSMDLLRANVNAIFAERFHMAKEDVEEIWDVIEDKCQNVTIKKGDLFRVFTYIMKDYLFPGKKKKKVKEDALAEAKPSTDEILPDETLSDEIAEVSEALVHDSLPTAAKNEILAFVPAAKTEMAPESDPAQTQGVGPKEPEQPVNVRQEAKQEVTHSGEATDVPAKTNPEPAVVVTAPIATEEPVSTTVIVTPVTPVEEPVVAETESAPRNKLATTTLEPLVKELLEIQTYKELISVLDQKKEEGALIYGRLKTMRSPEKCYLAIFKKSEVVTILDKGDKERLNLKTRTQDTLNDYKGHGVIWFQIF